MQTEPEKSLTDIVKGFERHHFRYLVIGGHAVIQYGSPMVTKDYDIWIDSKQRDEVIDYLAKEGNFEMPAESDRKRPIVKLLSDWQKLDLFCMRKLSNLEGKILDFDECLKRANAIRDLDENVTIMVPSIKDLIALKKMRKPNAKDSLDIAFLEKLLQKKI